MRSLLVSLFAAAAAVYVIDDTICRAQPSLCRSLDGIGGLSGGGATSVLLPAYPEPQKSQILDYLFKPNFGASLHLLKVEIGGDAQSTDGSESSHMHNPWEENYYRGYEWMLMVEAKKRNPNIKLYGLAWAFPLWVSCGNFPNNCSTSNDPYDYPDQLATYVTKWVSGAKNTYNLDIDYIGSWNERQWNNTYLKTLRSHLDSAGFQNTKIVAPDSNWGIASDILSDPDLALAVHSIGAHYPGTYSSAQAIQTGKPLWASEDDSTYNNDVGAACWARVINQNFVNGNMTASINWNLLAAYQKGTNWYRAGIFNAFNPWTGAYGANTADGSWTVGPMVWATAHTTQFSQPGWTYLQTGTTTGAGAGHLVNGGSYVTLVDFSSSTPQFSIIIEKLSRNHSSCVRPGLPDYATAPETATFQLPAGLKVNTLNVWMTHWAYYPGDKTQEFIQQAPITVAADGTFSIDISVETIYTITTVATGNKGSFATPPNPQLFPAAHVDNFDNCPISSEAPYFADQNGIFECVQVNDGVHNVVMRQMVPAKPITWGGDVRPHSIIGHRDSRNQSMVIDGYISEPTASIMLGVHVQGTDDPNGLFWSFDTTNTWWLHTNMKAVSDPSQAVATGTMPVTVTAGAWHTYRIDVNGTKLNVWVDSTYVMTNFDVTNYATSGHYLIGTRNYGEFTQFDNIQLYTQYVQCGSTPLAAGAPVSVVHCAAEIGPQPGAQWDFNPLTPNGWTGTFSLRTNPSLCLAAPPGPNNDYMTVLANCNANDLNQQWSWKFDGVSPDGERSSKIFFASTNRCLDIFGQIGDIGDQMDAYTCGSNPGNQNFWYDYDQGEIGNEAYSVCVGVC